MDRSSPFNLGKYLLLAIILASILPFGLLMEGTLDQGISFAELMLKISSMSGLIAGVLFFWQILIGNRFFSILVTDDILWVNRIHRLIGKYGVIFALIHPIAVTLGYSKSLAWIVFPDFPLDFSDLYQRALAFGRIGLALLVIVWLSSITLRSAIKYRPWLYLHYLSYPMLALILLHAKDIGSSIAQYPVLKAFWISLMFLSILVLLTRLYQATNLGKIPYIVTKTQISGDIVMLALKPQKSSRFITPSTGQYCYIQSGKIANSHPYSVLHYQENNRLLYFAVKQIGKQSKTLNNLKLGSTLYLDGPYGSYLYGLNKSLPVLAIIGSVGIAPLFDYLLINPVSSYLIYCGMRQEDLIFASKLKTKLGDHYNQIISDGIGPDKITPEKITAFLDQQSLNVKGVQFLICGSPGFNRGIKQMIFELGVSDSQIRVEDFGL
ncbi:ferric reductase-like transmembrane domain-containing protein [Candidatus Saccharibacteria bacterium]|nr:ferric reductase-like transmembrane domain-containing protein [Candidatus Saccharibacteria bacterium]